MLLLVSCHPLRGVGADVAARLADIQKRFDVTAHLFADMRADMLTPHNMFERTIADVMRPAGLSSVAIFRDGVYTMEAQKGPMAVLRDNMPDFAKIPGDYKKHAQTYAALAQYFSTKKQIMHPRQMIVVAHDSATACKPIKKIDLSTVPATLSGLDRAEELLVRRALLHPSLIRDRQLI